MCRNVLYNPDLYLMDESNDPEVGNRPEASKFYSGQLSKSFKKQTITLFIVCGSCFLPFIKASIGRMKIRA